MAINWQDRVPTRPNRMKITPENGGASWYGTIERADEPSVEGTPVNAANLNAMQLNAGLDAHKTVYVAVNGSDSVGNGTSSAPYATIAKALSMIPKNLNGFNATIHVAGGTYNEDILIDKYFGGKILFANTAAITIKSLRVFEGSSIELFSPVTVTGAVDGYAIYVLSATLVARDTITTTGATSCGVFANRNAYCRLLRTVVNNSTSGAIMSTNASFITVSEAQGSGNTGAGLRVGDGGFIFYGNRNIAATTANLAQSGGRIYSGAQTSIPNY